jgi:hypothetical protein
VHFVGYATELGVERHELRIEVIQTATDKAAVPWIPDYDIDLVS